MEGAGGFEGPVEFRVGQVEAKRGRVARRKQVVGQEDEGEVAGDEQELFWGRQPARPTF